MEILLTVSGQLILLLNALWMLKTWQLKDENPGWYSAAFCSGLLITSFAASSLIAQVIDMTPMFWFEQLALYAAFPLLSFVLIGLVAKFDWPKEAWGRILLGVCGIYWLCQQTQQLDNLLLVSSVISCLMALRLMMLAHGQLCIRQKGLFITTTLLAISLVLYAVFFDEQKTSFALAFGVLLYVINRSFLLVTKQPKGTKKV